MRWRIKQHVNEHTHMYINVTVKSRASNTRKCGHTRAILVAQVRAHTLHISPRSSPGAYRSHGLSRWLRGSGDTRHTCKCFRMPRTPVNTLCRLQPGVQSSDMVLLRLANGRFFEKGSWRAGIRSLWRDIFFACTQHGAVLDQLYITNASFFFIDFS
jgi:hypothetical protein